MEAFWDALFCTNPTLEEVEEAINAMPAMTEALDAWRNMKLRIAKEGTSRMLTSASPKPNPDPYAIERKG